MRGCSVQNSPRSCRLAHLEILLSGPPSTVSSWRLTAAARRKNSSPENLTHLHYNLLGKDSRNVNHRSLVRGMGTTGICALSLMASPKTYHIIGNAVVPGRRHVWPRIG